MNPSLPAGVLLLACALTLTLTRAAGADPDRLAFSDPARIPPPPAHAIGFPSRAPDLDVLPGFRNPPPGYGEVAFYWWLGDPLTRERLRWQLDQLAAVNGVMGLQINYAHSDTGGLTYGLTFPSDPPLFSDAWWNLVGWFMGEAKKRGMAVSLSDYTLGVGQGWTVDKLIHDHPEIQGLVLKSLQREAAAGEQIHWPLPRGVLSATAIRTDLPFASTTPDMVRLPRNARDGSVQWTAPEGTWKLVAVYAERVQPSINPMHPRSGELYASRFFGQFTDRFPGEGGRGLNWFFSDELEFKVSGFLWSDQFASEFHRRKGYHLGDELAALFTDIGRRTEKVRLDYGDVKVALTEEAFFKPVFDWHQQRGMIYGCDHGGRGRDVVEFGDYFRTQRWNQGPGADQPGLGRDIIKNKVASSIAHLYQRPKVWLEGYYGSGWGTTTAQLTDATFANFAQGQNLLTLHGLYYSTHGGWWEWAPPCNHFRMPYWPHMRTFFACTQRLGYLLSQGDHRCDLAVVYPVAPMEAGLGGRESVESAFAVVEHLYKAGIDVDFIDFESLARARIEGQELHVSGERYRALVLPALKAARWSTLASAAAFDRAGGLVIVHGAPPEASDRLGRNDRALRELVGSLQRRTTQPAEVQALVEAAFPRDFTCVTPASNPIHLMHRRIGPRDVYAVYGAPAGAEAEFRATGRVELWDPWTGDVRPLPVLSQSDASTRLRLPLSEKEIQLVVFSPGRAEVETARPSPSPTRISVEGPWDFELKPTLDNRFGDFRWPPAPTLLGPEARRFRYHDESTPSPGWETAAFDDSAWDIVTAGFGPKFWKLGPFPSDADLTGLDAQLAPATRIEPAVPVRFSGKEHVWQPYAFSWRWGLEGDPGHQGYHGLKGVVHDDFIGIGRRVLEATGTRYDPEPGGTRTYLWTSVSAPNPVEVRIDTGSGLQPAAAWIDGRPLALPAQVALSPGVHPLLLRYDKPGRGRLVIGSPAATTPQTNAAARMAMSWHHRAGLLPLDTRPQEPAPAGWYRFVAPPGLKAMVVPVRGSLTAWADGEPMTVSRTTGEPDGFREIRLEVNRVQADPVVVALRVQQERGLYAGEAIPEPVRLECGPGRAEPGDWTRQGVLESYSGGAWYRKTISLTPEQVAGEVELDLGHLSSSAEVVVNGTPVGTRVAPPWRFRLTGALRPGENRLEVLVLSALGGHYTTIPTRYPGTLASGLMGPVHLSVPGHNPTAVVTPR